MRLVANNINGVYLRGLLEDMRLSDSCEGVSAAVAYLTWADDLIDFCIESSIPLKLFCLFNEEARPSPAPVERILQRAVSGWELWFTAAYYHPKIVWFRGAGVYIGSANLTRDAWYSNVEAGLFFEQEEISRYSLDAQLTTFFATIKRRFRQATREDLDAIRELARRRQNLNFLEQEFQAEFAQLVTTVPGMDAPVAVGHRTSEAEEAFAREWTGALEKLRSIQQRLADLHKQEGRRWVPGNTPLAVEVDQALNFYYENHTGGEELTTHAVDRLHQQNSRDPSRAVDQMLQEWMEGDSPAWIRRVILESSPLVRELLQPDSLDNFTLDSWKLVCANSFAILTTARQLSNATLGKPKNTTAPMPQRAEWYAEFTWFRLTEGGHSLADLLRYLLWNEQIPSAQRVWNVVYEREWKLPYFGIGSAGELIGMARPDDFPPRNNRVSRTLYALGFDVERYGD